MSKPPRDPASELGFRELERFVAVVEHGGLAEAARTLGVTQQALGRSLTKLESILDAKLLHRAQGSQTRPTIYGEAFLQHAKSQLNGIAQAVEHVQSLAGARAGSVALGIAESCDMEALATAVREFHAARPDVELNLVEGYTQPLLDQLVEGELDCVVGSIPEPEYTRRGVVHEPLYNIDDVVVARAQHPLFKLRRKKLRLADLREYTWLVARRRPHDWAMIRDAFLAEGLDPPERVIRTDAVMVGMQLMLADDFLLMVSPTMVQGEATGGGLRRVPVERPTITRHAGLMTMDRRQLSPAIIELMELVRARSSEHSIAPLD